MAQPSVSVAAGVGCPRCGEPPGALPALSTTLTANEPLGRCPRCGQRYAPGGAEPRLLAGCGDCGLPYLTAVGSDGSDRCPDCRSGRMPKDFSDSELAEATESEIRSALGAQWDFVTEPVLSPYLARLTRRVAQQFPDHRGLVRAALFDDPRALTFSLPSGSLAISLGTLDFLEDEAQLVFLLAHELSHSARPDSAAGLIRLGFQAVSREERGGDGPGWAAAARDLIRLGYGRSSEIEADLRALRVVVQLGYDPGSIVRYLHRLGSCIAQGDERFAELALAHPPPADRLRAMEKELARLPESRVPGRTNREVFRRAAARPDLFSRLESVEPFAESEDCDVEVASSAADRPHRRHAVWILALLALAIVFGWLLIR